METLRDNIAAFHKLLKEGRTTEAMEKFYSESVVMQENNSPPRAGKKLNLEHEQNNLKRVKAMHGELANMAMNEHSGIVFSEWRIQFTDHQNKTFLLEEVSVQHWKNNKVVFERFYYNKIRPVL
jgi:hypothetical protein